MVFLLCVALFTIGVGLFLVFASRLALVITTCGITARNTFFVNHYIPWNEVARIDLDASFMGGGRIAIVTKDGRSILPTVSGLRLAMDRGEAGSLGGKMSSPTIPLLVARDAHTKYLRGEFESSTPE